MAGKKCSREEKEEAYEMLQTYNFATVTLWNYDKKWCAHWCECYQSLFTVKLFKRGVSLSRTNKYMGWSTNIVVIQSFIHKLSEDDLMNKSLKWG